MERGPVERKEKGFRRKEVSEGESSSYPSLSSTKLAESKVVPDIVHHPQHAQPQAADHREPDSLSKLDHEEDAFIDAALHGCTGCYDNEQGRYAELLAKTQPVRIGSATEFPSILPTPRSEPSVKSVKQEASQLVSHDVADSPPIAADSIK
ncbi:hypothetical protein Salat_1882200 [Sesamum alatum]|uniref:Uncharacterized protein n=1 Tax=Sesamum alatum TaxID=300844 RepID=A0AAE1Y3A6_9LAMI|nr:hypothetical protein Salat_1882200 [Sesamum alatum]